MQFQRLDLLEEGLWLVDLCVVDEKFAMGWMHEYSLQEMIASWRHESKRGR